MFEVIFTFVGYILLICVSCVLWNFIWNKKYPRKHRNKLSYMDDNNDYKFSQAVKEIEISETTRIELL